MSIWKTYRLQGGALIHVMLISLVISTLLSSYLILNHYQHQLLLRHHAAERSTDNLQSGLYTYLTLPIQQGNYREFKLFDAQADSASFYSEPWGLFALVHGMGIHQGEKTSRSCLVGQAIPTKYQAGLILNDMRQPLVVVGNTRIEGLALLPPAGIKSGYIGRKSYTGTKLHYGQSKHSKEVSLPLDRKNWKSVRTTLEKISHAPEATESYFLQKAISSQAWENQARIFEFPHSITLQSSKFEGKCQLISAGELSITADNQLMHTLIFARHIHIQAGFKGSIQAFATESITVDEEVELMYPSVLFVAKQEKPGNISIAKGSSLEGAVIFDLGLFGAKKDRNDYVSIEPGAVIYGQLYAQHNLDLKGTVYGSVYTDNFLLKTPAAMYRNHLLDATIRFAGLDPGFSGPLLYQEATYQLIEWL